MEAWQYGSVVVWKHGSMGVCWFEVLPVWG